MRIALQKPIVFFDLETTGLDIASEKIVELSAAKLYPDGNVDTKTIRINPGKPIPPEATAIHGISYADVEGSAKFSSYAKGILAFFEGSDIGGFNCLKFDIPFLMEEFRMCGLVFPDPDAKIVDVQRIYHKKNPRDLAAALLHYCQKEHIDAHSAEADILATIDIFKAQMDAHDDIGDTLEAIQHFCTDGLLVDFSGKLSKDADGDIIYAFRKHKHKKVKDELDYAAWMIERDFAPDTKWHLRKIIEDSKL